MFTKYSNKRWLCIQSGSLFAISYKGQGAASCFNPRGGDRTKKPWFLTMGGGREKWAWYKPERLSGGMLPLSSSYPSSLPTFHTTQESSRRLPRARGRPVVQSILFTGSKGGVLTPRAAISPCHIHLSKPMGSQKGMRRLLFGNFQLSIWYGIPRDKYQSHCQARVPCRTLEFSATIAVYLNTAEYQLP